MLSLPANPSLYRATISLTATTQSENGPRPDPIDFHVRIADVTATFFGTNGHVRRGLEEETKALLLADAIEAATGKDLLVGSLSADEPWRATFLEIVVATYSGWTRERVVQRTFQVLEESRRRTGPASMFRLLSVVRDLAPTEEDRARIERLRGRFDNKAPLPRAFDEGIAVPCAPDASTWIDLDEPFFLRVGQREGLEGLFVVEPTEKGARVERCTDRSWVDVRCFARTSLPSALVEFTVEETYFESYVDRRFFVVETRALEPTVWVQREP